MAALGDVVLDGYLYPACALYSYRCLYPAAAAAKGKSGADEGGWRPRGGGLKIKKKKKKENDDHGIWSHHFMGNRWGNSGNSVRYILEH